MDCRRTLYKSSDERVVPRHRIRLNGCCIQEIRKVIGYYREWHLPSYKYAAIPLLSPLTSVLFFEDS